MQTSGEFSCLERLQLGFKNNIIEADYQSLIQAIKGVAPDIPRELRGFFFFVYRSAAGIEPATYRLGVQPLDNWATWNC